MALFQPQAEINSAHLQVPEGRKGKDKDIEAWIVFLFLEPPPK